MVDGDGGWDGLVLTNWNTTVQQNSLKLLTFSIDSHSKWLLGMNFNPVEVLGDARVHSGQVWPCTTNTPRDEANKKGLSVLLDGQRTARVALARVLPARLVARTQHVGVDLLAPAHTFHPRLASGRVEDFHVDLLEDAGRGGHSVLGPSPTRHLGHQPGAVLRLVGQTDGHDVLLKVHLLAELEKRNVVLIGGRIVLLVDYFPLHAELLVSELLRLAPQIVVAKTKAKVGGRCSV